MSTIISEWIRHQVKAGKRSKMERRGWRMVRRGMHSRETVVLPIKVLYRD